MQMTEKAMVNDVLTGINGELVRFGEMIPQTENKELKQTLKQFRNACEASQEQLYQMAREKSYYVPASKATAEEVQHVKSLFTGSALQELLRKKHYIFTVMLLCEHGTVYCIDIPDMVLDGKGMKTFAAFQIQNLV